MTGGRGAILALGGVLGAIFGVVAWGGFNRALEATNDMGFCISCHEMRDNVYQEYRQTAHYQNPSGVRATCPDCHVPRDWGHKLLRKAAATKELYHWLAGSVDTAEKFEAKRHQLAKNEWARMRASDSRECRNCHAYEAMSFHKQSAKAARAMTDAAKTGKTCIDCHKGIAHKFPDVAADHRRLAGELPPAIAPGPGFVRRAAAFYPAPPPPESAASPGGELAPGAAVHIVAVNGDWAQVEITGWRREGADTALFARSGKRMALANLSDPAAEQAQTLAETVDPDTELTWRQTRLTAWTRRDGLTGDAVRLRAVATRMQEDQCALCHPVHPAEKFTANDWVGHMNAMKRLTGLSDDEARLLLAYLQNGAKDASGAASPDTKW
jgi:trimethylamine-N-oxide reductase (cytochrome c), cytochrome c-type subunit TorC